MSNVIAVDAIVTVPLPTLTAGTLFDHLSLKSLLTLFCENKMESGAHFSTYF